MREIRFRKSYEKEGFRKPVFEYRRDWPYLSIGFGNERDYFIENMSLLISSGMGISNTLEALLSSVKTQKMKTITAAIKEMVEDGSPLWKAFQETKFFPDRIIALIRSGEESGRLPEHLNLVTIQQHKEKVFKSRLRSALLYPGIVLFLAFVVGLGSAWFLLPHIVDLFKQSTQQLPQSTQILIWFGAFFESYGIVFVPVLILLMFFIVYMVFVNRPTKFLGDAILFSLPGIKTLVQGVELAQFGYMFGAMLQAGFPIHEALQTVKEASAYVSYQKFYDHLGESIVRGETFKMAFDSYKKAERFIPIPIQQLIISAEKSGKLTETFIKIALIFEEKTEAMSKDLTTILEPIVLIVVGLIVAFVVSGVIGPIYGIYDQIN